MKLLSYITRRVRRMMSEILYPINPLSSLDAGIVLLSKESRKEYREMSIEEFAKKFAYVKKAVERI